MAKRGFSLIELMVVITIIGVLALMMMNFDFNKKTDMEKRDRFAEQIASMIRTSKNIMMSGKGVPSGTGIINPDTTHIFMDTGSIGIYYYSGSSIVGTGQILRSPFYGESGYTFSGVYYVDKNNATQSGSLPLEIIFDSNNDISFSGGVSGSGVTLGLRVNFHASGKTIEFDRRSGKIVLK